MGEVGGPWPGEALPDPPPSPKGKAGFLPVQLSPNSSPWKRRPWGLATAPRMQALPPFFDWDLQLRVRLLLALPGLSPSTKPEDMTHPINAEIVSRWPRRGIVFGQLPVLNILLPTSI